MVFEVIAGFYGWSGFIKNRIKYKAKFTKKAWIIRLTSTSLFAI